jgi:hypothetical protein
VSDPDDLTYSGMRPKGDKWKNARRVDDPAALQRLEGEIEDLRALVRDLSLCLSADARLIATCIQHRGPDSVDATAIYDHARELLAAQVLLEERRKRAHEMRGGT